jgi:hypothetical protein
MVPFTGPSFAWGQPEPVSGQTNPRTSERVRPIADVAPNYEGAMVSSMRAVMYRPSTRDTHRRRPRSALPLAIVVVLMLGACGPAQTRADVTKAQFIARADAICRAAEAKLAYIRQLAAKLGRAPGAPPVMRQEVAAARLTTARLESLPEPPGESEAIDRWLTARTVAATVASDAAEAPAGGDRVAVKDVLRELGVTRARAARLARNYGLEACGATG